LAAGVSARDLLAAGVSMRDVREMVQALPE
jgi:hypothetical protein